MARSSLHDLFHVQVCEQITVRSRPRPLRQHHFCFLDSKATFSTSTNWRFPRKPLRAAFQRIAKDPGFRSESQEQRRVREHNLFDPHTPDADVDNLITRDLIRRHPAVSFKPTLGVSETSIADLEKEVIWLAAHTPPGARLLNTLDHIIIDRRRQPNTLHYEALILANALPEEGSAENVRSLIQEMRKNKLSLDSNDYTAILRTMVVHPDADIVADVIESCAKMWIELDLEMLHLISAAYIRAGMPELGLEYLSQVEKAAQNSGNKTELWLYVLTIRHLALEGDWDGVIRMCYRINDDQSLGIPLAMRQIDVPYDFWHWLLEHAAAAGDQWVTCWIWKTWVLRTWIRPRPRLCVRVLEIAAEHGLVEIAESALTVLNHLRQSDRVQDIDSKTGRSWGENREEVRELLAQAYANAPEGTRKMTPQDKRLMGAHWWMFKDRTGAIKELEGKIRFDPWAALDEHTDPGHAWPRVLHERSVRESQDAEWRKNAAAGQMKQLAELTRNHDHDTARSAAGDFESESTKLLEHAEDVHAQFGQDKENTSSSRSKVDSETEVYYVPAVYKKKGFKRLSISDLDKDPKTD